MATPTSDGGIILTTDIDTSGAEKGFASMSDVAKTFGNIATAVFAAATGNFALLAVEIAKLLVSGLEAAGKLLADISRKVVEISRKVAEFSKEAASAASSSEASIFRLVDIYAEAAGAVGDFIDQNAMALGMSKSAAAGFASVYGNLFSVWADSSTNAQLTNRYLQMTAVVASKTGRTVEDVQERIRSGLLGNTEAIEDLGVFVNVKTIEMTDAFQRMANGKSWEQLDAYAQQQIRTMAILEQATQKYGNEVSDTSVLARGRFSAAWEEFKNTWGKAVNVILIPILNAVTSIIEVANYGLQALLGFSNKLLDGYEKQEETVGNTAEKQEEITDSIKEQTESQKDQRKMFASFDTASVLSDGGAGETDKPTNQFDFGALEGIGSLEKINELFDKIADKLKPVKDAFAELGSTVKSALDDAIAPFGGWFENFFADENIESVVTSTNNINSSFDHLSQAVSNLSSALGLDKEDWLGDAFSWLLGGAEDLTGAFDSFSTTLDKVSGPLDLILALIGDLLSAIGERGWEWITYGIAEWGDVFAWAFGAIGNLFQFLADLVAFIIWLLGASEENGEEGVDIIVRLARDFVNTLVDILNVVISVINIIWLSIYELVYGIFETLYGWVDTFGNILGIYDIPDVGSLEKPPLIPDVPHWFPELAKGAVLPANKPFLAMVGDQKNGTNIEAPAELIKQMAKEAIMEAGSFGNTTKEEHYYLSETEVMRVIYKMAKGGERLNGGSLLVGGV